MLLIFYKVYYLFYPPIHGMPHGRSVACFSEFCESSQNSRGHPTYIAFLPLSTSYDFDILLFILGMGHLSQGERRGKEKSLSKKRVPTNRYVLGV